MARQRYGEKSTSAVLRWIYFILFGLIAIWLLSAIITRNNPVDVLKGLFSKMPVNSEKSCEELLVEKDSIIDALKQKLAGGPGAESGAIRGIVLVDSQSLNMRSKPSLQSDILLKIPANSEVLILYYDSETYYLDGEAGRWARIRYADTEGWVWGNYVKEI